MKQTILLFFILLVFSCQKEPAKEPVFTLLSDQQTGISFSNNIEISKDLNIFNYMYFYNGGGVGAGDFNQDGLIDLFFTANLGNNELYLNKGQMKFENITEVAQITQDDGWSTGVSVVDINNDGLLDIYVSQVGKFRNIDSKNQLLVCKEINSDGVPIFENQAAQYGLDIVGFCTQAAFFDYDLDGDLDLYQMRHSLHNNGTFGQRKVFQEKFDPLAGDLLFRNDGGVFTDVTKTAGINSWIIGYGLGLAMGDVNLDGYPDLYIGNDFHENDYLYLNQKDGTFKEVLTEQLMHTSRFSMGVDIADLNNDAQPDIISLDMLPEDPYILRKSEGENDYGVFNFKLSYGYHHQYAKNALQVNNGNGTFSEVAMLGDVHATDWSWAALLLDFDNDGLKDLFISNGIPKRMNDMDYINFISTEDFKWKTKVDELEQQDLQMIEKIPEIKLSNKFFHHSGNFLFSDLSDQVENNLATFSNGAIYADLDNDGDLDLVTNNINARASIYNNQQNTATNTNKYLNINLKGSPQNLNAIGAKIIVQNKDNSVQLYENFPVKGFQSSMQIPLHVGLGDGTNVENIFVVWPDNTFETIKNWEGNQQLTLSYQIGLATFDYDILKKKYPSTYPVTDQTTATQLDFKHKENPFVEFNREPLIPHSTSTEGPALAVGDLNGDGLEDLFFGGSKRKRSQLFFQKDGTFQAIEQAAILQDSVYEDVAAEMIDVNNDGHVDLVVATGGNEYKNKSEYLLQRVYLNDGAGNLTKLENAIPDIHLTASCVAAHDFNDDGFVDLFIGGRAVPASYGEIPTSYLLENDGTGHFKNVTATYHKELANIGFVNDAQWVDLNQDGKKDLILALEWDGIVAMIATEKGYDQQVLTDKKGWWTMTLPYDFDGDGDIDLIAGNLGQNSRLKASVEQPIRMYYADFDDNGKKEQVLTYYLKDQEIPFANMMELQKQMPVLKKKYLKAEDFAKASLPELLGKEKLQAASVLTANYFSNAILINQGDGTFETQALPAAAQYTTYKTAIVLDANGDDKMDVFLGGNYYHNNIQMGRLDADYGTLLLNQGQNNFEVSPLNGLQIKGQIRQIRPISIHNKTAYIIARNDDSAKVISFGE